MKKITSIAIVSLLVLSGMAFASQSGEQKGHSSMMGEMMKREKGMEGMSSMGGMMGMMKMVEQCSKMMESSRHAEESKDSQKK